MVNTYFAFKVAMAWAKIITRCSSSFALLTGTFAAVLLRPLNTALAEIEVGIDNA